MHPCAPSDSCTSTCGQAGAVIGGQCPSPRHLCLMQFTCAGLILWIWVGCTGRAVPFPSGLLSMAAQNCSTFFLYPGILTASINKCPLPVKGENHLLYHAFASVASTCAFIHLLNIGWWFLCAYKRNKSNWVLTMCAFYIAYLIITTTQWVWRCWNSPF